MRLLLNLNTVLVFFSTCTPFAVAFSKYSDSQFLSILCHSFASFPFCLESTGAQFGIAYHIAAFGYNSFTFVYSSSIASVNSFTGVPVLKSFPIPPITTTFFTFSFTAAFSISDMNLALFPLYIALNPYPILQNFLYSFCFNLNFFATRFGTHVVFPKTE